MRRKYNEEEVRAVHARLGNIKATARHFGCSWDTVRSYLKPEERKRKMEQKSGYYKNNKAKIKITYDKYIQKKEQHLQAVIDRYFSPKI